MTPLPGNLEDRRLWDLQRDVFSEAGCDGIFEGADGRPVLRDAMDHVRAGDTLVVWRLDRLGQSLKDLIEKADTS